MKRTWRDPFLERLPLPYIATHHVLGVPVTFAANRRWLARLADDAFASLPSPSNQLRQPVRINLVANADLPRGTFQTAPAHRQFSNGDVQAAIFSQADAMLCVPPSHSALVTVSDAMRSFPYHVRYEMIEQAAYLLAGHALGAVPLHAGCIARQSGVLLCGHSGAGKSTLTFACLIRGWRLVSEDGTFLLPRRNPVARGAPNFIHLLNDASRFFDRTWLRGRRILRRSGRGKLEIDARHYFASRLCAEAPISALVFIERAGTGRLCPTLRRLTPAQARARLIRQQPFASAHPRWPHALDMLCQLPAHLLLPGHDVHASVEALEAVIA